MTTQPDTTPPGPGPDTTTDTVAAADQAATQLLVTSIDALTATMAAGMLDVIGQPRNLPTVLFPDTDPDQVQAIWNLALTVGFRGGIRAGRPRWEREELQRAHHALTEAGCQSMARLIRKALTPPGHHPADPEQGETRDWTQETHR